MKMPSDIITAHILSGLIIGISLSGTMMWVVKTASIDEEDQDDLKQDIEKINYKLDVMTTILNNLAHQPAT